MNNTELRLFMHKLVYPAHPVYKKMSILENIAALQIKTIYRQALHERILAKIILHIPKLISKTRCNLELYSIQHIDIYKLIQGKDKTADEFGSYRYLHFF